MTAAVYFLVALIVAASIPLLIAVRWRIQAEAGFRRQAVRARALLESQLWHPLSSRAP